MHQTLVSTIEKQECELDLTKLEDRQQFSEAAEDLYIDAMHYEPHLRTEQYNSLALSEISGREVFQTAEQILIDIQKSIQQPSEKAALTNKQIDNLQSLYNDLAIICEYIESTCQSKIMHQNAPTRPAQKIAQTTQNSIRASFSDKEVVGRLRRTDLALHQTGPDSTQTLKIASPKEFSIKNPDSEPVNTTSHSSTQDKPSSASQFKTKNTIPHVQSKPLSPGISKPNERLNERSLTAQFLQVKPYVDFIANNYTSAAAFERLLDMRITQIEAKTTDAIERWLGEKHESPFIYLQDKTIADTLELSQRKNVRTIVIEAGIKYETFLTWIDLLPKMLEQTNLNINKTFGELFARFIIEIEMQNQANK